MRIEYYMLTPEGWMKYTGEPDQAHTKWMTLQLDRRFETLTNWTLDELDERNVIHKLAAWELDFVAKVK